MALCGSGGGEAALSVLIPVVVASAVADNTMLDYRTDKQNRYDEADYENYHDRNIVSIYDRTTIFLLRYDHFGSSDLVHFHREPTAKAVGHPGDVMIS
ncbi:MAG TPA: hypothetical protein ENO22_12370 [candidate division Zixibacteria bacterium]|nr:hypothetical protein [candidate division Zixibacteria bacterium]